MSVPSDNGRWPFGRQALGRWAPSTQAGLVAQVWLLSRGLIALMGALLVAFGGLRPGELLRRWDVLHFMAIADNGYSDPTAAAFFPGLPLLLRTGTVIHLPMEWAGVLVALIGSALAAAALYHLFGAPAACLWLLAPTAVFTVVGYTEAPFCAAAFWAWQRAKSNHWGQAAVLAGLACTFRISGVFLLAGLVVLALLKTPATDKSRWVGWGAFFQRLLWLLVPLAVLGAFELYLHHATGSWQAWLDAQQAGWGRGFTNPLASLGHTIDAGRMARWPGRPEVPWVFRAEIISLAVGLITTAWCIWRRKWAAAVFVALQVVAFGTSYWYMSVNRAILVWFPLWAMLGAAVVFRPSGVVKKRVWSVIAAIAVVVDVSLMLLWAWLFFTGRWAS